MANPAIKRIFASIGARAPVFRGGLKGERSGFRKGERGKFGISAPFRDKKGKRAAFENMESLQKTGLKAENSIKRECRNWRKMPKQ